MSALLGLGETSLGSRLGTDGRTDGPRRDRSPHFEDPGGRGAHTCCPQTPNPPASPGSPVHARVGRERKLPAVGPVPVAGTSGPLLFAPLCAGPPSRAPSPVTLGRGTGERRGPSPRFSPAGRRAGALANRWPPPSRWSCVIGLGPARV